VADYLGVKLDDLYTNDDDGKPEDEEAPDPE
jgi:hypothetical protein